MLTDLQLLSRYHLQGDATAFRDLVQAHAGMVFATARRITHDEAMAEDVAQETFFQLARQSRHITQSVAAWLHRVAWRRACNAVRDVATRRRIEEEAAASEAVVWKPAEHEASWAEVEAALDEAIDALPDELRGPLVMHFLQGRSQREIAEQIGVNQSTVSRRVDEGLSVLRDHLKTRGLLCGVGLAALLTANGASAAPAAMLASLAKMSMSGIGATKTVTTGAASAVWLKVGTAALLTVGGAWFLSSPLRERKDMERQVIAAPSRSVQTRTEAHERAPAVAVPTVQMSARLPAVATNPAAPVRVADSKPMPVHELVHSFPAPPKAPTGHLVLDDEGMLWGTCGGGRYGRGALYRMSPDGSVWEEMVSFNGHEGVPQGGEPQGGVSRAPDGRLWGATSGTFDPATLFCFDPRLGKLTTEIEFERGEEPVGRPTVLPDGQVWFSTRSDVFLYDPATRKRALVMRRETRVSDETTVPPLGELVPDGRGWLWATCGDRDQGNVCKINQATGEMVMMLTFTGVGGAFPGRYPVCGLALDADGFLWGCTRNGGLADRGTVFKIHAETGIFTSVAHFEVREGVSPGANPETMLADDGQGWMWGTASYTSGDGDGSRGHGTIYRVERRTGKLSVVATFTGVGGATPGGPARGHLLRAGPDHFVGASGFGGAGNSGTIYRVDIPTGQFAVLKDMAGLATSNEGMEPHGALVEVSDGSLWGTTFYHGVHYCGTIYKLDPASRLLVTVVDFTGTAGPNLGRNPDAGLVSDGRGWLWGTTRFGGSADAGTIFKLHEQTGVLTTIAEFGKDPKTLRGASPMTEMALDERGQLWGTASSTVFKVDPRTDAVKTIVVFGGDEREPFGSNPVGRLAVDGRGHVWGCSLADRTHQKASLFRISTADDAFETVEVFPDAGAGWSGWHPSAQMYRDSLGSIWFTGVLEQGGKRPRCTLNRLDPVRGRVVERYFSRSFPIIDTPVEDGHGRLWGTTAMSSLHDALYSFDVSTGSFRRELEFTGHGSQSRSGSQPMFGRPMRASDGNIYSVTRYGPGNGGTIYRLRFGPTPMTQEAVILAKGQVELHGVLCPNGRDTEASFEWGVDPMLRDARTLTAGTVGGWESAKPVQALLSDLKRGSTHYFRVCGRNSANAVLQRGAILSFVIPEETAPQVEAPLASASSGSAASDAAQVAASAQVVASAESVKHKLRIIMVPGAGAGIVRGWRWREGYEIGKSYTLTALADNRYVFASWSGVGISGAAAENPQLSFVFTEELARNPVITVTFVRNPFHDGLLGPYHGLVRALEGVQPGIGTTGALELKVEELGDFTGVLRYDGDELPITGVFDTGGSARFGDALAFTAVIPREEKPALLLSLQLDLSEENPGIVRGQVGQWSGEEAAWQSQAQAMLDASVATLAEDAVVKQLIEARSLDVEMLALDSNEVSPAQLLLQPDGRLQLSARLPDGTDVLSEGHLNRHSQISFFQSLNLERSSSLGVEVPLTNLLQRPQEAATAHGWWLPPAKAMRPITLQAAPSETDGK